MHIIHCPHVTQIELGPGAGPIGVATQSFHGLQSGVCVCVFGW